MTVHLTIQQYVKIFADQDQGARFGVIRPDIVLSAITKMALHDRSLAPAPGSLADKIADADTAAEAEAILRDLLIAAEIFLEDHRREIVKAWPSRSANVWRGCFGPIRLHPMA